MVKNQQPGVVFKALSDENRIRILQHLQHGAASAGELRRRLHIGQSTLSHHMKVLCDCGLVNRYKAGKWTHYAISQLGADRAIQTLRTLTTEIAPQPPVRGED